jgi:hypothetical protein
MANVQYDFALIGGQVSEFEKLAAINPLQAANKVMNMGRWIGAGGGALAGGLAGRAAAQQTGDPLADAAARRQSMFSGAFTGGILGLGAGQMATSRGRQWMGHALQRQAHGLTGYMPGSRAAGTGLFGRGMSAGQRVTALRKMEMNVPTAAQVGKLQQAREALTGGVKARQLGEVGLGGIARPVAQVGNVLDTAAGQEALKGVRGGTLSRFLPEGGRLQRGLANINVRRQLAGLEQSEKGFTSIPGIVKGLATRPGTTLSTNLMAAGGLGVAMPLAFGAPGIVKGIKEKDPEAAAASAAETAAYALGGGLPFVGNMAFGSLARKAATLPVTAARKILGRPRQQTQAPAIAQAPVQPQQAQV